MMRAGGKAVRRKVIEGLILAAAAALLAQLLLTNRAHGQTARPDFGDEKFVEGFGRAATVELKSEATAGGSEVKLKQLVRWGDVDDRLVEQAGELVVARMQRGQAVQPVRLSQIKEVLEGAGINIGLVQFCGAAECKVAWSDPRVENVLEQVGSAIEKRSQAGKIDLAALMAAAPTTRPVFAGKPTPTAASAGSAAEQSYRTLKDVLLADLVQRFGMPIETFAVKFSAADERLIALSEPYFRFDAACRNAKSLGNITWDVTISTEGGQQKVAIEALVQVWRTQVTAARPVAYRQVFGAEDVSERKVLMDYLKEEAITSVRQVVGQQASQDVGAGMMIVPRMVETVQVVRAGQLITVIVENGAVQLKWVAEARESGAVGQTIRVRKIKSDLREEFNVIVTGPQEGKLVGGLKIASR